MLQAWWNPSFRCFFQIFRLISTHHVGELKRLLREPGFGKGVSAFWGGARCSCDSQKSQAGAGRKEHPLSPSGAGGWEESVQTLFSCRATEKSLGDQASPVGAGGGPRGARPGPAGRVPGGSRARASRPSLGVSGSSMATRRRRATRLTPHFQIKMAQAPGLGREPLPPASCRWARPQEEREAPRCGDTPPAKA